MPPTTDTLSTDALEWAISHIDHYGDTDIFPIPFEYKAIRHDWNSIKTILSQLDLSVYQTRSYLRCLVPKPTGGYRVAIQLDPLDTIVFSAMVYECAEQIENARAPKNVACSYRVKLGDDELFESGNPWQDVFNKTSIAYAQSGEFKYVVLADISDFYNQIYHHRLMNNLESSGVPIIRAQNIEKFLFSLTGRHHSRGVPVGPSASILLAETCLIDVDQFLMGIGLIFTRYVDDFRIFCRTKSEANRVLHDLSEYLYTSHRLVLQANKSTILSIDEFLEKELGDPEQLENQSKSRKINAVLEQLIQETGYPFFPDDLDTKDIHQIALDTIFELFGAAIQIEPLPLGLSRYVLRRARMTGTAIIQKPVLENLDTLAPVFRDVILYLLKSSRPKTVEDIGKALMAFLDNSDISFTPFLRTWCMDAFTTKPGLCDPKDVVRLTRPLSDPYRVRYTALFAREHVNLAWVRSNKENWNNHSPWETHAILWAGKILGSDERTHWLGEIARQYPDPLIQAIAKAVISGIE